MDLIGKALQTAILKSRWLIVPFLLGLIVGLCALLYNFFLKLWVFLTLVQTASVEDTIVALLKIIDLTLVANFALIVIWSSYENFVARIEPAEHRNLPEGLIGIGFSGLKQRLLGSIAAIAAVNVLEWFMDVDRSVDNVKLAWVVGILLAFTVAMVMVAFADRLSERSGKRTP
ncbi:MAG TPA: YqhA family protein [Hyphomicrobiales bacterium]|nr:YqhA family protein [Hyphomicrobiales bacterium]